MRVIDHRRRPLGRRKRGLPRWLWPALKIAAIVAGSFVFVNLTMLLAYHNRVLPNYSAAAIPIGNLSFSRIDTRLSSDDWLPASIELKKDNLSKKFTGQELGITVDRQSTGKAIRSAHSWLPLLSLFTHHTIPVQLTTNDQFGDIAQQLGGYFTKEALPERIVLGDQNFAIAAPEAGFNLDTAQLKPALLKMLAEGGSTLEVPTVATHSGLPSGKLGGSLSLLNAQLGATITLMAAGKKQALSRAQIASFYEPSGQTQILSDTKMNQVIGAVADNFGLSPVNQSDAVQAAKYALNKSQPVNFVLAGSGATVHRYCTAARGVDAAALPELEQKLAATYGDPRGWNQAGIAFVHVASGCEYTVWLSAASQMTTFSSVCDNYYNCQAGNSVIVNADRWNQATPAWNDTKGTLEDYRILIIDHETGHRLGFYDNPTCPGAGQPAPVMMQQSIDLHGCTFNWWPTAAELAAL